MEVNPIALNGKSHTITILLCSSSQRLCVLRVCECFGLESQSGADREQSCD